MHDEMQRLREDPHLFQLLDHYVRHATDDREAWLDRCMDLAGGETSRLSHLHGLLIAFGWLEQNSGQVPIVKAHACPRCYRTTPAGRRAVKHYHVTDDDADNAAAAA